MNVLIERIGIRLEAMWGVLTVIDTLGETKLQFYTGELSSNRVPAGEYVMRPDATGRFQEWRLYGNGVNDGVQGWEDVEFHSMNWPRIQSKACIGLGETLSFLAPPERGGRLEQALGGSKVAFNRLRSLLLGQEHVLIIREPSHE